MDIKAMRVRLIELDNLLNEKYGAPHRGDYYWSTLQSALCGNNEARRTFEEDRAWRNPISGTGLMDPLIEEYSYLAFNLDL